MGFWLKNNGSGVVMLKNLDKTYHVAIYLRLSQENGYSSVSHENETKSISTRRDLILN